MRLSLQRWPGRPSGSPEQPLMIFLHGLNGHSQTSWGLPGQPQAFIQRLSDAHPRLTVATLDYPCDLRDYALQPGLSVTAVARRWARLLRLLLRDERRRIAFITHCLGGLVTLLALRQVALESSATGRSAAAGLDARRILCFLMDAPLRLPGRGLPQWLDKLVQCLRLDANELQANCVYYNERQGAQPMLRVLCARQVNWLTPFEPAAIGGLREQRLVDTAHEDMSRAPAQGPHAPLACAVEAVDSWLRL